MSVSVQDVKRLRETTGAGMMACKEALAQAKGDLPGAVDLLRKKGLAQAREKRSRVAAEGTVATLVGDGRAVAVEVNCETDFVAKGGDFRRFAASIARHALDEGVADAEALGRAKEGEVGEFALKCGEKVAVRRVRVLESPGGVVGAYNHGGRIGVLVGLAGGAPSDGLPKDLAMHIAAADPRFIGAGDIDEEFRKRESDIYAAQLRDQGKPEAMIPKIVQGKLRKLAQEVCLLEQKFVRDQDKTVGALIREDAGEDARVTGFVRMNLGEGIERKEADLAREVAEMTGR